MTAALQRAHDRHRADADDQGRADEATRDVGEGGITLRQAHKTVLHAVAEAPHDAVDVQQVPNDATDADRQGHQKHRAALLHHALDSRQDDAQAHGDHQEVTHVAPDAGAQKHTRKPAEHRISRA